MFWYEASLRRQDTPELEVYAGRLMEELYHLDDVSLPEPVEAGAVGDHRLVQLADLRKNSDVNFAPFQLPYCQPQPLFKYCGTTHFHALIS